MEDNLSSGNRQLGASGSSDTSGSGSSSNFSSIFQPVAMLASESWRNSKQDNAPKLYTNRHQQQEFNNERILADEITRQHQQEVATTTIPGNESNSNNVVSDFILQYVNLNLVRKMIAQNQIELIFICVIITYLIYYFSQISRRPRLIGNDRSKFVKFIRTNLGNSLRGRFSPLIYFWGTNPQTALFGYLQGQTSLDEMPRNKFRRQYLYVSDAQYLTSNVDLSQHYGTMNNNNKNDNDNDNSIKKCHPLQLRVDELQVDNSLAAAADKHPVPTSGLLDHNIRLALNQMLESNKKKRTQVTGQANGGSVHQNDDEQLASELKDERDLSSSSSSGSSSDSGVFAGHSSSSSSSSTSSLADVVLEMGQDQKCSCKILYDLEQPIIIDEGLSSQHSLMPSDRHHHQQHRPLEFGQCALDWHKSSHKHYHKNKLVALISAGMTTGSDKKYVTDTVMTLERLGYEVCVFIRRGVGGLKLSSTKFFSPAKWRDFEAAVMSIKQQRPGARLVAIGFSFGSIELCRYLSMSGKGSLVNAALLISCPFDPEAGGRNMRKRALNRRIDAYLAKNLGKQLYQAMFGSSQPEANQSAVSNLNGSLVNLATLPKIKSLVDFEDNFNRILQNYPNSEAYAADSRLQDHLSLISTPTLCLSSEDDFMAPLKLLPLEQIRSNRNLCMILTKRGGHMAFIDGIVWPKRPYFAQRIIVKYMGAIKSSLSKPDQLVAGGANSHPERRQSSGSTASESGRVSDQFSSEANFLRINNQPSNNNSHHLFQMGIDGK